MVIINLVHSAAQSPAFESAIFTRYCFLGGLDKTCPQEYVAPLHGLAFDIQWVVMNGFVVDYQTICTVVVLD